MPSYHPAFRSGEFLRVTDAQTLTKFQNEWVYHHPLQEEQIAYAGEPCFVRHIACYHGGDCLYRLGIYVRDSPESSVSREKEVPGVWHEACLRDEDLKAHNIPLPPANEVYTIVPEQRDHQPVVVIRTISGMECLVLRHLQNVAEAALMTEVAGLRNTLSFERRYNFQDLAQEALHQLALERQTALEK